MKRLILLALPIVLAACGQTNPELIPQSNAQALQKTADRVDAACTGGDRSEARAAIRDARQQIDALPGAVSEQLRTNLSDWIDQINSRIGEDCQGKATPTPTESATEAPTETPTAAATKTATPTATATQTATPTATPTATDTPNTGGGVPAPTTTPVPG